MHSSTLSRPLIPLLLALTTAGCFPMCGSLTNLKGNFFMSSGDMKDDDVEEPIPAIGSRFEPVLVRSNEWVAMLHGQRLADFYEQAFDDSLKQKVSLAELEKLYGEVLSKAGPVQSCKPQQWKFAERGAEVSSTKIVHHERGSVYYTFTLASPAATRLIGLHFRPRPAPAAAAK